MVTAEDVKAYMDSKAVQDAKKKKKWQTASLSFHDFIKKKYTLQSDCQAVCHGDLSALTLACGDFSEVDFSGATISNAITACRFKGAYLVGTQFKAVTHEVEKEGNELDLSQAILAFSFWSGVGVDTGADLSNADLTQADLSFANLEKANLTEITSEGAKWYKTVLTGVTHERLGKALAEQKEQVGKVSESLANQEVRVTQLELKMESFEKELEEIEDFVEKLGKRASRTSGRIDPAESEHRAF